MTTDKAKARTERVVEAMVRMAEREDVAAAWWLSRNGYLVESDRLEDRDGDGDGTPPAVVLGR